MAYTDDSLGFNLNRTNIKLKNAWTQHLKPYGVKPEQCAVLFCLWEQDGVSPKDLSFLVCKDAPTTVRILEKLIKKGLIKREADLFDKRSYRIYLTAQGCALQGEVYAALAVALQHALKGITQDEKLLFMKLLKQIYTNLESEEL